ncbi:MAG: ABC transporter substrate-binding protein, partial [Pseudomonadota bacterium]
MRHLLSASAVTLCLGSPAFAQDAFCGGISVVGDWAGGGAETSDVTTADTPFDGAGQVPIAGHLVRMFTLSDQTDIRVEVAAQPAGDPYISIFDVSGVEVAADDDSGGNFASRVEASLDAGTYCLAARSYESGVTDVDVRIGRQDHAALTGGAQDAVPTQPPPRDVPTPTGAGCGDPGVATLTEGEIDLALLAAGITQTSTVGATPAFAFTLSEATPLTVTANSELGDPLIRLLDEGGAQLAENDDTDGLNSRIDLTDPLPPGAYCIELEDLNGSDNPIEVGLETFDPVAERNRRLNAAEFAPLSQDDVEIIDLGTLGAASLTDVTASADATWLSFELPEGGLLVAEAIGSGVDPALVLFDRVGRRLGENDDGPN